MDSKIVIMLPDFIIAGAMKSGTTALFRYINDNSDSFIPYVKETHFFDNNYDKGVSYYQQIFEKSRNIDVIKGEATPSYMYINEVPKRIKEHIPDVKIILILRDPVSRAYSHYWHNIRYGNEELSFKKALEKEGERVNTKNLKHRMRYSYKDRGKYIDQIKRYEKYFSKEQILILFHKDLKDKPDETMNIVFNFLKIKPKLSIFKYAQQFHKGKTPRFHSVQKVKNMLPNTKRYQKIKFLIDLFNLRFGYPQIEPKVESELKEFFKPYNKRLEKHLNIKLNW